MRQEIRKIELSEMDLSCLLENMAEKLRELNIVYNDGTRSARGAMCAASAEGFESLKLEQVTRYPGNDPYNEWVLTLYYRTHSDD